MRQKRIYFTVRTKLLAGLTQKIYDSTFSGGLRKTIVSNNYKKTIRYLIGVLMTIVTTAQSTVTLMTTFPLYIIVLSDATYITTFFTIL